MTHLLAVADAQGHDDTALLVELAARRPEVVTIVLQTEFPVPGWAVDEDPESDRRRTRLAELLVRAERATGAAVSGFVGDATSLAERWLGPVVGDRRLPAAA